MDYAVDHLDKEHNCHLNFTLKKNSNNLSVDQYMQAFECSPKLVIYCCNQRFTYPVASTEKRKRKKEEEEEEEEFGS